MITAKEANELTTSCLKDDEEKSKTLHILEYGRIERSIRNSSQLGHHHTNHILDYKESINKILKKSLSDVLALDGFQVELGSNHLTIKLTIKW